MAKFVARVYHVTHCGYFEWGEPEPSLGGLGETLQALKDWSVGKTLLQTRVAAIGEGLPSYLFDIKQHGGCWIVTLWNQVPAEDGKVQSVQGSDLVGGAGVHQTALAAGAIPGFPSYAVFYPEEEIYVALKHGDVLAGTEQVKSFFQNYLQWIAPWVRVDDSNPAKPEILGYLDVDSDNDDEIEEGLTPRFVVQVVKQREARAAMVAKAESIRKVVRVREFDTTTSPARANFQRVLEFIGLEGSPRGKRVRIRQETPVKLTRDQLVAVLNTLEPEVVPKKNDLAVYYDQDPRPHWLSGMIPSVELEIAVDRDGPVYLAQSLARSMAQRKTRLLGEVGL